MPADKRHRFHEYRASLTEKRRQQKLHRLEKRKKLGKPVNEAAVMQQVAGKLPSNGELRPALHGGASTHGWSGVRLALEASRAAILNAGVSPDTDEPQSDAVPDSDDDVDEAAFDAARDEEARLQVRQLSWAPLHAGPPAWLQSVTTSLHRQGAAAAAALAEAHAAAELAKQASADWR
jgi:hypothetical protein